MKILKMVILFCSMLLFSSCIDEQVLVDNTPKPDGRIVITSQPAGAHIYFLGTDINKVTPDSILNLESGDYDLTLKLDGYRDTTFVVTVLNSYKTTRKVILTELLSGTIYVQSDPPGAHIYLGGKNTNKLTPDSIVNVNPGSYSLSLRLSGFRDTSFTVTVQNKEISQMNVLLKDTLPEVETTIDYNKIQFGQLLFSFEFTRDVKLKEILYRRPDSTNIVSIKFDNELVAKGETRVLIFNNGADGFWYFTVKGQKADGDKRDFEIFGDVEVK